MLKNIILRLSNEVGNQMFMYAAAYSIAKKMNRSLYLDDQTAFLLKKNISSYGLNHFKINTPIVSDNHKFKYTKGYLKRKFLIKTDFMRSKKKFFIENKDKNKITNFSLGLLAESFDNNFYLEGHFESEKYFNDIKNDIKNEFTFKDSDLLKNNFFYKDINKFDSVGICLRQNRFLEGRGKYNNVNREKSENFTIEQINYINRTVDIVKTKINNPKFFLWSNDLKSIPKNKLNFEYTSVDTSKVNEGVDNRILSLFLLKNCKHFITTTSSFNWWGAWLSTNSNKLVFRPSDKSFSDYKINNKDFWPSDWILVK
tara:strand:+ start:518 stop:1456 length:939 start_codon:yes stop_codon:yes gene_type:complete